MTWRTVLVSRKVPQETADQRQVYQVASICRLGSVWFVAPRPAALQAGCQGRDSPVSSG